MIAYGKWQDRSDLFNCLVIELADVGSLHHVLYETDLEYTLGHGISWLKQCASAINYLHLRQPKPTIHRDLKPLNLLLMRGGVLLKVCDFGTACNLKTFMTANKGSPCWIAPEQFCN
jgi:mitogen-activated protein kinase kinase kinase 7